MKNRIKSPTRFAALVKSYIALPHKPIYPNVLGSCRKETSLDAWVSPKMVEDSRGLSSV